MMSVPKYSRVAAAAVLLASPSCFALAPVYFDLGPLVLGVLAVVFGLFVLVGRRKGAIAFFVVLGGVWLWAAWLDHQNTTAARKARAAVAEQCFAAGQSRAAARFAHPPHRIVVASDAELDPGSARNPLWVSLPRVPSEPGVEFVRSLPPTREPDTGYVEIRILRQPIPNAENWYVNGLRVTVTDEAGHVMGDRTDFARDYGWCLGGEPFDSTEKFLRDVLGRSVGVGIQEKNAQVAPAVLSPKGQTALLERGRFHESQLPAFAPDIVLAQRQAAAMIPTDAGCAYLPDAFASVQRVTCLRGTPQENSFDLRTTAASFRSDGSWWLASKQVSDVYHFDSMDLEERSLQGALQRRWHIRFLPVYVGSLDAGFNVRNAIVRGRVLTADVLFDRQVESVATKNGDPVLIEWFGIRIPVTAVLVEEPGRVGER